MEGETKIEKGNKKERRQKEREREREERVT